METATGDTYDVVIIGAGLAGLTLARHLLLYTDRTVLLLVKRTDHAARPAEVQRIPRTVQQLLLSKVLDPEEHLLINHNLKYNLRFYWQTPGLAKAGREDYTQS